MNVDMRSARVIAVASGKGGVGKTNVSVNLAVGLQRLGRETMLVDCDLGLANANIVMGIDSAWTLADVLSKHCAMDDVVRFGPEGVRLIPGHSGTGVGSKLGRGERDRLAEAFRPYADELDHIIVDTGSGLAADSLDLVASSDLVLLVLSPEPTAFMDAYATAKALSLGYGCADIMVVANMVENETAGRRLFDNFSGVIGRFLDVRLGYLGAVPSDSLVREAVLRKRAVADIFPSSAAGQAFSRLARKLAAEKLTPLHGGARFFGMEEAYGAY